MVAKEWSTKGLKNRITWNRYGNWVKMIHFGDGEEQKIRVEERTITFYE
jgi:hypothetical protein